MKKIVFCFCVLCSIITVQAQKKAICRYATVEDSKQIRNANEGDYLITEGNLPSGAFPGKKSIDIQPRRNNTFKLDSKTKQRKILIKGGEYPYIIISLPGVEGTRENPIIITNYDGQVKTKKLTIAGMKHVVVTGEFNAKKQTGDPNFPGHAGGYAYSSGKYGIYVDKQWGNIRNVDDKGSGIIIIAGEMLNDVEYSFSDIEISFIEAGNGGFSNEIRWNNHGGICDNMCIHDCYIHDTYGEGIYLGSTQKEPQTRFRNFKFYNNRVIRAGWDAVQFGKILSAEICNNVIYGSLCWKITDIGDFHDKCFQMDVFTGNVVLKNNIFVAGGALTFMSLPAEPNISPQGGTLTIDNNLFLFCRKDICGYYSTENITQLDGIRITNNIWGKNEYLMHEINTSASNKKHLNQVLTKVPLTITDNISDGTDGKKEFYATTSKSVTAKNNQFVAKIDYPEYINTGFPTDFNWLLLERWGGTYTVGNKKGQPVMFYTNDYVVYKSVIYKAKKDNAGIEPGVNNQWTNYWEVVYFDKKITPPDDFRLRKGTLYSSRGIGLLDNP